MPTLTTLSIQNAIAIITLNHPEKNNILSEPMRNELTAHYHQCEQNTSIKIIILNANGKHFCAGADLNEMLAMGNASFDENLNNAKQLAQFFYQIYACKKPTICCIHGKALGGGVGLAAAHDIMIATQTAEFCFPEVKLGLMPATIAPFVLRRIGCHMSKTLMLTAEMFSAKRAYEIKLIDYLYEHEPIKTALLLAEKMQQNNLAAMQAAKTWLQALSSITPQQLDQAARWLAEMRAGNDAKALMAERLHRG